MSMQRAEALGIRGGRQGSPPSSGNRRLRGAAADHSKLDQTRQLSLLPAQFRIEVDFIPADIELRLEAAANRKHLLCFPLFLFKLRANSSMYIPYEIEGGLPSAKCSARC